MRSEPICGRSMRGEIVLWVMIESRDALKNCREIAKTPGIGGLFIGPSDLAFSLGVPLNDPAVEVAIENVAAIAKETGVPLGTLCGGNEVQKRLSQGFQFLAVGSDGGLSGSVSDAVKAGRTKRIIVEPEPPEQSRLQNGQIGHLDSKNHRQ